MQHSTQLLAFTCVAILAACNVPPSTSAPVFGSTPKTTGSQSTSPEFAPGPGPTPLQYAVLDLDSKPTPKAQKVQNNYSTRSEAEKEAKKEATASLAGNDLNFIQRISNDSQSAEQAALYVASKTTNNDIRNYAALMGRELGKANQQLRKLAAKRNIETPSDPSGQLRAKLDQLRQLTGQQMEQTFLMDFGVQANRDLAALFEVQKSQTKDKELNDFVTEQLPLMRERYEQGKALNDKYMVAGNTIDV